MAFEVYRDGSVAGSGGLDGGGDVVGRQAGEGQGVAAEDLVGAVVRGDGVEEPGDGGGLPVGDMGRMDLGGPFRRHVHGLIVCMFD